jgi:hypothetical protein
VVDALIPATRMLVFCKLPAMGYDAVLLPYEVSGPNSTATCPAHGLVILKFATSGCCVLATDTWGYGGVFDPPPHAIVKLQALNTASKTAAFDIETRFIFLALLWD